MRTLVLVIAALVLSLVLQVSVSYSILGYTIEHLFPMRGHGAKTVSQETMNVTLEIIMRNRIANGPEGILAIASNGPVYLRLFPLEIYDGSRWFMGNLTLYPRYFKTLLVTYNVYSNEPTEFEINIMYYKSFKLGSFYVLPLPQPAIMPLSIFDIEANATIYSDYGLRLFVTKEPVIKVKYTGTYDNPYPYGSTPLIMGKTRVSLIIERLKQVMAKWYNRTTISSSSKVKELAREIYEKMESRTLEDLLNYIREYLANTTEYTKDVVIPPKEKDFVEYFLFESKKGSCIAYSSAAAIILREIGIPARVVLGFVGEKQPNGQVVFKLSGHVWVEIYISDAGWIPYDPTPSVGVEAREFNEILSNILTNLNAKYERKEYEGMVYDRIVVSQRNLPQKNINKSLERLGRLERFEIEEERKTTTEYVKALGYLAVIAASVILISHSDVMLIIRSAKRFKVKKNPFKRLIEKLMRNFKLQLLPYETPREAIAKLEGRIRSRDLASILKRALSIYEELSFGGRRHLEEDLREIIRKIESKGK